MHTLYFTDGEHETLGCLACGRAFLSKTAVQQHFDREPSHEEVTITAPDIETGGIEHGEGGFPHCWPTIDHTLGSYRLCFHSRPWADTAADFAQGTESPESDPTESADQSQ